MMPLLLLEGVITITSPIPSLDLCLPLTFLSCSGESIFSYSNGQQEQEDGEKKEERDEAITWRILSGSNTTLSSSISVCEQTTSKSIPSDIKS